MQNFRNFLPLSVLLFILITLSNCGYISSKEKPSPVNQEDNNPPNTLSRLKAIPNNAVKIQVSQDPTPPILHVAGWKQPIPLEAPINTPGAEDSPFITPDGSTLFFFFTPDVNIPPEKQIVDGVTGIYETHITDSSWSEPERVQLIDNKEPSLDGCPFLLENILWFCSARQGNFTPVDFYTAERTDSQWINWKNVGEKLNEQYNLGELHISADHSTLLYHSDRKGGFGGLDLWFSKWEDDDWGQPINLAELNTQESEGWPFLSSDGKELWFTRTYQGTPAVFRSLKQNDIWGEPQLIISQFAGEPTLDAQGNLYFVHHFYLNNKMIEADIYVAYKQYPP
jgi:hypothetical protein